MSFYPVSNTLRHATLRQLHIILALYVQRITQAVCEAGESLHDGADRSADEVHRPFVRVAHTLGGQLKCQQWKLLHMEGSVYFGDTVHV